MTLLAAVASLQFLILVISLAVMGMDLYFVNTYINNPNVVFIWRFYVQMGLTGCITVFFLISVIILAVRHRRRRYEPTSPSPSPSYVNSTGDRFSLCQLIVSVVRTLISLSLAVGMLYVTVKALINENRSVLVLPSSRESLEYQSLHEDFRRYDPMNLRHCPAYHADGAFSLLCPLDKLIMAFATMAAVLAIVEAPLTFVYNHQSPSTSGKRRRSEHVAMDSLKF